ncbi:DUF6886 family protein [Paenibacillus sp. DMB20]|uniref:DUF6886 family protein n=1 Tax=Paenibacillus sp. DMB20 TaxID=1642570 RepID=UPI000627565D|nr:DUF6886 family protein [Paenibacillus sp. DMB20]KKO51781.1 hypothetical protein XI25_24015 [Paenibacillus sp. DMB20]
MNLYHFSEEENIEIFKPRVKENRRDMPPIVWAIDEEHQFTFYFPRDCPRIVYTRSDDLTREDERRFFGNTGADIVITVETGWFDRIMSTTLYRYELPGKTFELFDATAGYYISKDTVVPTGKLAISNGLEQLMAMNMDVRFTPDLYPLREAVLQSSIKDFGIHRFENAVKR